MEIKKKLKEFWEEMPLIIKGCFIISLVSGTFILIGGVFALLG